jgi:membrane protein DedA with SNARE-associated domain
VSIDDLLQTIPPLVVYLVVGVVVGVESLGVPLPGEIVLVSAAVLSSRPEAVISPVWVAVAGALGAIIGDSIGYGIGHRYGRSLFDWAGRRFPRHFGPRHVALAERAFQRWGVLTVIIGRFIALLRIFAGPLAGVLRMPYAKFLPANIVGGVLWVGATTTTVYFLGLAAEKWLSRFSYVGLIMALVAGLVAGWVVKRRVSHLLDAPEPEPTD